MKDKFKTIVFLILVSSSVYANTLMYETSVGTVTSENDDEKISSSSTLGLKILYGIPFKNYKLEAGLGFIRHNFKTVYEHGLYESGKFSKDSLQGSLNGLYLINEDLSFGLGSLLGKLDLGIHNSETAFIGPLVNFNLITDNKFSVIARVGAYQGITSSDAKIVTVGLVIEYDSEKGNAIAIEKPINAKRLDRVTNGFLAEFGSFKYIPADKYTITIKSFAEIFKKNNLKSITLIGHADKSGDDAINNPLSLMRAESVKEELLKSGINVPINVIGKGSSEQVGDSEEAKMLNRRVEFIAEYFND